MTLIAFRHARLFRSLVALLALLGLATDVFASPFSLPENLSQDLISESVPTAFEVAPFHESDFQVRWKRAVPADVRIELVPGSLTWVRIARMLVLPRARIRVHAPQVEAMQLRVGRSVQQLASDGKEAPVSLFSGSQELSIQRNGKVDRYPFELVFSPAAGSPAALLRSRVFVDSSCSSFRVEAIEGAPLPVTQWAFLGCRMVYGRSGGSLVPQLEVHLAWAGTHGSVLIGGIPQSMELENPFVATVLLSADQPRVRLQDSSGASFEISAGIPRRLTTAFVGVGLGPYSYLIQVPGEKTVQTVAPITTLYGSYFLAEGSRVVFFDAFPVQGQWYNDFGLYFNTESSRALDERLSFNLLLGFHLISFKSPWGIQHRLGAPQGFEVIYRDALGRRTNLSVGGFFYPPIAGKAYYNTWLRIGSSRIFGELNYLSWRELAGDGNQAISRSVGISVGAPLVFW
jgi:hypothetical protein